MQPQYQKNQQVHSKIKHFNLILVFVFIGSIFYPLSTIYAALSCSVTTAAACTGGSVVLLRMSGSTNAHAELPSQSNANYASNVVCCSSASAIGNSCSGNFKTFAKLSAVTNAHAQQTSVNTYGTNACLSDTTSGDILTVGYQNTNCTGYDTTLFSMTASDNATVGDGSAYTPKVCATIFTPTIVFSVSSSIVSLGTLSSGSTATGNHTITANTNAVAGFALTYNGDTLKSGGNTIAAWGAQSTPSIGAAQFGLNAASPTGSGCAAATGYQTGGSYAYTANTTTNVSNTTVAASCTYTITYAADIPSTQPAGTYTTPITWVMTGTF